MTTMNRNQAGDVLLFQGPDDGDIFVQDGITEMTQGFESMLYIILVGSNEDDDGSQSTEHLQWLGNEDEPPENQIRGKFHKRLNGSPITSGTLKDLQADAVDDITAGFGDMIEGVDLTVQATSNKSVSVSGKIYFTNGVVETFGLELFKQ